MTSSNPYSSVLIQDTLNLNYPDSSILKSKPNQDHTMDTHIEQKWTKDLRIQLSQPYRKKRLASIRILPLMLSILSKTGCLEEREMRSRQGWTEYASTYLDILEEWLVELRRDNQ